MCPAIYNPTSCEIRAAYDMNMNAADIHNELFAVCGQNVKREGTVRQWCRMFKDERTNVDDEEQSGQLSAVNE
jgi:hypothetical protein